MKTLGLVAVLLKWLVYLAGWFILMIIGIVFVIFVAIKLTGCPNCGSGKSYEMVIGGKGGFRCPQCGHTKGAMTDEEYWKRHFTRVS